MSSASIEEVRSRLDIVDVVSQSVSLRKAGRNFKAPCPFHNEKTPSFVVNPERQTWHCFGACGTGGDAFSFVMKREGLEFGEALRTLAEKVGVTLETRDKKAESKTSRLLEANKAAAAFFHHQLLTEPHSRRGPQIRPKTRPLQRNGHRIPARLLPSRLRRPLQEPLSTRFQPR